MIIEIAHIRTADNTDFVEKLRTAVEKMQIDGGLDIEVQYQTASIEYGCQYVVYTALVIGRKPKQKKGGE